MKVLFVFLILLLSSPSYASTAIPIHPQNDYDLIKGVDYLIDDSRSLELNGIQKNSNWQAVDKRNLNFGFLQATLWLRFKVVAEEDSDWLLNIPYPLLDHLESTSIINGNMGKTIITGDQVEFSARAVNNPGFVFPYELKKHDVLEVYLKVNASGANEVPLKLMSRSSYVEEESIRNFILGWMNGILIIMLLYNLTIFFIVREKVYLYYVLSVIANLTFVGVFNGTGFQFLWPNSPGINNEIFPLATGFANFFHLLFIMEFLQIRTRKSWYTYYFKCLLVVLFFIPIISLLAPYQSIVLVEVVGALILYFSGLAIGVYLSFKGETLARLFTLAWSILMLGLICANLKSFGLFPSNWFTTYAYQFGIFIELTVLSIALAHRIEALNKEKSTAQLDSIKNLKRYQNLYRDSLSGQFEMTIDGTLININPAFYKMLGYSSAEQLLSLSNNERNQTFNINQNGFDIFLEALQKNKEVLSFETQLTDKHNNYKWYSISMVGVNNEQGAFKYYEGSMISINELKENEQIKINAVKERMIAMEQLVIGICHEMNTPLGVVTTGLSHLAKGTEELNDIFKSGQLTRSEFTDFINDGSEAITLINKNLDRLNILITSFKNISILQRSYAHTSFNIAAVIDEQVFFSKKSLAGHTIKVSCPTDLTIKSYPQALSDMIQQFINNSLRHGFVDETAGEIDISVQLNGKHLEIVYRDNGIGISQDKHKDIFNPFYTTKRGSNDNVGLGMFQVYNIVTQLLEGDIHIADTLDGFEVFVRFPIEST